MTFKEKLEERMLQEGAGRPITAEDAAWWKLAARAALLLTAEECGSSATYWELKSPGCSMARALRSEYDALRARAKEIE